MIRRNYLITKKKYIYDTNEGALWPLGRLAAPSYIGLGGMTNYLRTPRTG